MDTTQAKSSLKKLYAEMSSLTPSALIVLFEIDVSNIVDSLGKTLEDNTRIFRFHNNVKLINTTITWQGNEYVAAPVIAEGFEETSKGTFPRPKLGMSVSPEGIPALAILKNSLRELEDLAGAQVTRRRTFAKFLDRVNFPDNILPEGFDPDPNSEFTKDIFFIDRKSLENKTTIEFELASIIDVEGIQLPRRRIYANRCPSSYRGAGCLYEYENNAFSNRVEEEHGKAADADLPTNAVSVATVNDELIADIIGRDVNPGRPLAYDPGRSYLIGDQAFVLKNNIKYYFVAKVNNPTTPPPNTNHWIADACSKSIRGCKCRWNNSKNPLGNGTVLPFGGFPAANKVR